MRLPNMLRRHPAHAPLDAVAAAAAPADAPATVDAAAAPTTAEEDPPATPGVSEALPHLKRCLYFDYNATTPIFPEVTAAMRPFTAELFGNPSSSHAHGRRAAAAVAEARRLVAELVGAAPDEMYFCACGTEADNWAIWGAVMAARARMRHARAHAESVPPPHVVTCAIEHPAVLVCLEALSQQGLCSYTAVRVDGEGLVAVGDVEAAMRPETALVTIMHSNNEVGGGLSSVGCGWRGWLVWVAVCDC
jgi:cysteine desulfurase